MQDLCKHDAMSCRSFVCTWVLESVWILNPDIHGYQWKIRNVSSLSLSDLSLLTPLHCLTSFPYTLSSLPSARSLCIHFLPRIPRLLHLPKAFVPISASNDFFFFMRHLQSIIFTVFYLFHSSFQHLQLSWIFTFMWLELYAVWNYRSDRLCYCVQVLEDDLGHSGYSINSNFFFFLQRKRRDSFLVSQMRFCNQESYPHKAKGRVNWWLITCVFQSHCYFESGDRKILFRAWNIHPYFCLFLRWSLPEYPWLSLNLIFPQHQHPECWSHRWGQVKQTIFKRQLGLHLDASIAHIKQWTEITNVFTPCGDWDKWLMAAGRPSVEVLQG